MKVLMLTLGYGRSVTGRTAGGTEMGAKRLAERLRERGVGVYVIGYGGDISFPSPGVFWRITWPLIAFASGFLYLLLGSADIIYARYSTYPLFVGVALKYLFGRKLIASIHGGDIRHKGIQGMFVTFCLKRCDRVICYDNKGHIKELKDRGIEPTVIPNGIDLRMFVPRGKSKTKTKKVIYVGGTREIKGFYDIITASSDNRLNDGNKDFKIHIYADGSIASDRVTRQHPPPRHEEMPKVLETGQLFVLPSHAEGVPTAMLEAMASGMYVIASKLDYTKEVLDEKFLFEPMDSGRLADLMVEFRDRKKKYFGNQNVRNRKFVEDNHSIDDVADRWKFVLELVFDEKRT